MLEEYRDLISTDFDWNPANVDIRPSGLITSARSIAPFPEPFDVCKV